MYSVFTVGWACGWLCKLHHLQSDIIKLRLNCNFPLHLCSQGCMHGLVHVVVHRTLYRLGSCPPYVNSIIVISLVATI